ncbi:hypothetical protein LQ948_11340 [Jiella sp. MQZ9-1]|uniref:Uncharacterized protein n=1 Tax=Jiella flava TaxID=2816857 RepID=A0A939FYT6_9HYPH|nr:hypothetical protein [Jiella flava]MBO0663226.1 hypothetical protein [Jiella flava]MCD2471802.1 hypothetical protein [Jiella flava]
MDASEDFAEIAKRLKQLGRKHGNVALHCLWAFLIGLMWNRTGKSDSSAIAVSITVLQTFLVVAAFGGFWLLRSEALARAAQEIQKIAPAMVRGELYPRVLRELYESEGLFDGVQETNDDQIKELMDQIGRDDDARD